MKNPVANIYKEYLTFTDVDRFRLLNAFVVAISMNLLLPILIDLRGELLETFVISTFMIMAILAVKTNSYFVHNFNLSTLYRQGVVFHLLILLTASTYFISPIIFVYTDSILLFLEIAVFSAYSIKLNDYQAKNNPEDIKRFQIFRNSTYADGTLIGLFSVTAITLFVNPAWGIIAFLIFNTAFTAWLFTKWNFFVGKE